MLRKSVWITALLLALTFVFFGCDDSKYAKLDILDWKLSDVAAGFGAAPFTGATAAAAFGVAGLDACGGNTEYTVGNDGSLTVDVKDHNWGAGLDLKQSVFGFKAGDKITLKGTIVSGTPTAVAINTKPGGEKLYSATPLPATGANFTITATLTAEDITNINGASPSAVRIQVKADQIVFKITELTAVR
jgi:hypothetical protein